MPKRSRTKCYTKESRKFPLSRQFRTSLVRVHGTYELKTSHNSNAIKHLTDYDHWLIKPHVLIYTNGLSQYRDTMSGIKITLHTV